MDLNSLLMFSAMKKLIGSTVNGKIFSNGKGRIMLDDIQLPRDVDFGCHTAHITVTVPSGGAVQSLYKTAMLRRFGKVPQILKFNFHLKRLILTMVACMLRR